MRGRTGSRTTFSFGGRANLRNSETKSSRRLISPAIFPRTLNTCASAVGEQLQKLLLEDAEVDLDRVERVADLVGDASGEGLDQSGLWCRLHPLWVSIMPHLRGHARVAMRASVGRTGVTPQARRSA